MPIAHHPQDGPVAIGGYSQGSESVTPGRLLHVSGQIPVDRDGRLPTDFDAQCRQVWANLEAVLRSADMELGDLTKVTTYLSDRVHRDANARIRAEVLGGAEPALTVIIAGIYDERWLLEIEAVAFKAADDVASSGRDRAQG